MLLFPPLFSLVGQSHRKSPLNLLQKMPEKKKKQDQMNLIKNGVKAEANQKTSQPNQNNQNPIFCLC
jgi:hypothetical protein